MQRKHLYRRHCFTLVEIMVVVLILGMVLGLVGGFAIGELNKAKVENTRNQLLAIKGTMDRYYLDVSQYPNDLQDLVRDPGVRGWSGPYLQDGILPKDAWNNDFAYQKPGNDGRPYDIFSYGADGTSGGEDLNADIYPRKEQE